MFVLFVVAAIVVYLLVGAVLGGLARRWRLAPFDFTQMFPVIWPLLVFVMAIAYLGLGVMNVCDAIMNSIQGEKK